MADNKEKIEDDKIEYEVEGEEKPALVVEDDTPEEDRGRAPLPANILEDLEKDDLSAYEEGVKRKIKTAKKAYHDERREKEQAVREREEAINFAQRTMEENRRLKASLSKGEETLVNSFKSTTDLELAAAKKAYKEAYEAGDSDKVVEAQERLSAATYRSEELKRYKPALQQAEKEVERPTEVSRPRSLDNKTTAWQERNKWFGKDKMMTAAALGLHQELVEEHGDAYPTTDEYWQKVDSTLRRSFPDKFGETERSEDGEGTTTRTGTKPATVVAPVSRSTPSKKIVLKQSQLNIAKRLGLTPEQYAREQRKLEN